LSSVLLCDKRTKSIGASVEFGGVRFLERPAVSFFAFCYLRSLWYFLISSLGGLTWQDTAGLAPHQQVFNAQRCAWFGVNWSGNGNSPPKTATRPPFSPCLLAPNLSARNQERGTVNLLGAGR
jgi:hypothetical protein